MFVARALGESLLAAGQRLVTAESLTGGGIAQTCSAVDGASDWLWGGYVTYTPEAKQVVLGVPPRLLERHGAVSEPVARAMAEGALAASGADLAVAVTGIAGPGGGEILQPVGTVWFGWALRGVRTETAVRHLEGDRAEIRAGVVRVALEGARRLLAGDRDDD